MHESGACCGRREARDPVRSDGTSPVRADRLAGSIAPDALGAARSCRRGVPPSRRPGWIGSLVAFAIAVAAARAEGAPKVVRIVGDAAACPAPQALAAALGRILPSLVVSTEAVPGALRVSVVDLGARYRVTVGDQVRELEEPARTCDERARAAAVYVAVVVEPPSVRLPAPAPPAAAAPTSPMAADSAADVGREDEAARGAAGDSAADVEPDAATVRAAPDSADPSASESRSRVSSPPGNPVRAAAAIAPSPAIPSPPPPPPRRSRFAAWLAGLRVELEGAGALALAPPIEAASLLLAGGGGVRLVVRGSRLALSLGAAGFSDSAVDLEPAVLRARARLLRIPIDAGVRWATRRGRLEIAGEAGLLVSLLHTAGEGVTPIATDLLADVGLRLAGQLRVHASARVAPFLSIEAAFTPATHPLVYADGTPTGSSTPRLWLAASLGLALRLR